MAADTDAAQPDYFADPFTQAETRVLGLSEEAFGALLAKAKADVKACRCSPYDDKIPLDEQAALQDTEPYYYMRDKAWAQHEMEDGGPTPLATPASTLPAAAVGVGGRQ